MLSAGARRLRGNVPAFAPRTSQEQRAALVEYALQPGSSAAAAHRAALAGGLPCGAFEISYTRTAELVAAEREHRNGRRSRKIAEKGAAKACNQLVGDMLNLAEREARQLRSRASNQPVDTERLRRLARAVKEIRNAADVNAAPSRTGTSGASTVGPEERAQTLLEQLAAADPSTEDHEGAETTRAVAPNGDEGEATRSGAQQEPQTEEGEEAVRSSVLDVESLPSLRRLDGLERPAAGGPVTRAVTDHAGSAAVSGS